MNEYKLIQADKEAVRIFWPTLILPSLRRLKKKNPNSGGWTPEHVRAHLEAGFRGLILCELWFIVPVDGKPCGFIIYKTYNDEFTNVPDSLFIWITDCKDPKATRYILQHGLCDQRAKDLGLPYTYGIIERRAYLKVLTEHGYEIAKYHVRKKVM